MDAETELKRNDPVFLEWSERGSCVISRLDSRTRLRVNAASLALLDRLGTWTSLDALVGPRASVTAFPKALRLVEQLLHHEVILSRNSMPTSTDVQGPWERWGNVARLFHEHTRDAPYLVERDAKVALTERIVAEPPLLASKSYPDRPRLHLPRRPLTMEHSFEKVVHQRRTHRVYEDDPVSLGKLATLLQTVFAPQHFVDGDVFGTMQLRTSPNAGARHEVECYVAALAVEDLPSGIYHYDTMDHSLALLTSKIDRALLQHLLYQQKLAETVPVVCFTSAITERLAYKYRDARAYRLWLYDVGHVGQTFVLTATALELGAFQTAAFRDTEIDRLIGLDGNSEFVTYVLGCGNVANLGNPAEMKNPPPR